MFARSLGLRLARKLKHIAYFPVDTFDLIVGNRPPNDMIFVGEGSWRAVGSEFLHLFRTLGRLKPNEHVLDVGSGIGRMALPLTRYLVKDGSYTGFDIVKSGVDWCQRHISARHPNFTFIHADVLNRHYNPAGTAKASEYVFPFATASVDFVFLTSVFTHMFPSDLENYLKEIARVARPGGRCFMTFFLINEESSRGIANGNSSLFFSSAGPNYYTVKSSDPEFAIGLDETYVRNILEAQQLKIEEPISYGSWCGRKKHLSFQDIVVATKSVHF